jgi:YidC/Oxa1 family membrane protein insertase
MDQRRFLIFVTATMLIWIGWAHFIVPKWFPPPPKPLENEITSVDEPIDGPADALAPENVVKADVPAIVVKAEYPTRSIWIGPQQDDTDQEKFNQFFLAAKFQSEGASIETIELTDINRYPAFGNRKRRVKLVGDDRQTERRTFGLQVPVVDALLKDRTLDRIPWEVIEETSNAVAFRITSPDGVWQITKRFQLKQLSAEEQKLPRVQDTFADGYKVKLTVTLKNLSPRGQDVAYTLQGPTGIPLEDADNAYKYRDVRMGFLREDGVTADDSKVGPADVIKKEKAKTPVDWKRPVKYIGVDVAYFADLVLPVENQVKEQTLDFTRAVVVRESDEKAAYSDISVDMTSRKFTVPASESIEHEYELFAGPKRQELLQKIGATAVLDYGWFDSICRGMLWILNRLHDMGMSYGLAIICLTVLVRTMLIPLSKHQAAHAAKMKELQPKIQAKQKELEARHGKNTEEYLKASQELVAEQSKMMLGGCLPMFLQLPIFMALYRALSSSIDLRMEPFMGWIDNLASPDALFELPGKVWFLGWTTFNLLPLISIGLMMVHQKLTMPPPQNDEQKAQYKMMNVMMFVMGATFYRVPAGLCLYFISTNIWSMTERTIFERLAKKKAERDALNPPPPVTAQAATPAKPSWIVEKLKQLQEAADKDTSIRRNEANGADPKNGNNGNGSNGGGGGGNAKAGKKRGKR